MSVDQVKDRMKVLIEQEMASRKPGTLSSTVVLPSAPSGLLCSHRDYSNG